MFRRQRNSLYIFLIFNATSENFILKKINFKTIFKFKVLYVYVLTQIIYFTIFLIKLQFFI